MSYGSEQFWANKSHYVLQAIYNVQKLIGEKTNTCIKDMTAITFKSEFGIYGCTD